MRSARIVSRLAFGLVVILSLVVVTGVEFLIAELVRRAFSLGREPFRLFSSFFAVMNFFVALLLADLLYKLMGLSHSGTVTESRRPSPTAAGLVQEDHLEIRYSRSLSNNLFLSCLLVAGFIFVLAELVIPRKDQADRETLPYLYLLFAACGVAGYLIRYSEILRIDGAGITARCNPYSIRKSTIPWAQIASCELVVIRNTFGDIAVAYPAIKDAKGKVLFRGLANALNMASPEDRQKLFGILKQRFPKLDVDPWEL